MIKKGDWVVIEGEDMLPVKLEKDPYEREFITEGRPFRRIRVLVAEVPNPDCSFTNVELLREATVSDFNKHIQGISILQKSLTAQQREAIAILGLYLQDTSRYF